MMRKWKGGESGKVEEVEKCMCVKSVVSVMSVKKGVISVNLSFIAHLRAGKLTHGLIATLTN